MLKLYRYFTKPELLLWGGSCAAIAVIFLCNPHRDTLTLIASLLGATMLIFLAKGNPAGQIMTVMFALIYSVISYRMAYYGEMITYLGMTAPTAALAAYKWIKNPHRPGSAEVRVAHLGVRQAVGLLLTAAAVTAVFFFILRALGNANLLVSTISVTTSFLASALTVLRSHYYALAYGANDLVLICLWTAASVRDISCLPMVLCFVIFFINDLYGYANWAKMKRRQAESRRREQTISS